MNAMLVLASLSAVLSAQPSVGDSGTPAPSSADAKSCWDGLQRRLKDCREYDKDYRVRCYDAAVHYHWWCLQQLHNAPAPDFPMFRSSGVAATTTLAIESPQGDFDIRDGYVFDARTVDPAANDQYRVWFHVTVSDGDSTLREVAVIALSEEYDDGTRTYLADTQSLGVCAHQIAGVLITVGDAHDTPTRIWVAPATAHDSFDLDHNGCFDSADKQIGLEHYAQGVIDKRTLSSLLLAVE